LHWQVVKIRLIRCPGGEARMRPAGIVKVQIPTDRAPCLADRAIGMQIDLLVFDRTPQTLDDDVVAPSASAVHTDGNLFALQDAGEDLRSKLAALIGVEYLGLAIACQCFFQ